MSEHTPTVYLMVRGAETGFWQDHEVCLPWYGFVPRKGDLVTLNYETMLETEGDHLTDESRESYKQLDGCCFEIIGEPTFHWRWSRLLQGHCSIELRGRIYG